MNRDLFLAILAMDSYNRGYGCGIRFSAADTGTAESGFIGNATLLVATSEQQAGWQAAGFYAIAYTLPSAVPGGSAETIISYRGTDNLNPFSSNKFRGHNT